MRNLVSDWVGSPSVKLRTLGEELVYSDDAVYLYVQTAVSPEAFLVEGSYTGDVADARAWLDQLPALCTRHGVGCELVGDDGAEFEIDIERPRR